MAQQDFFEFTWVDIAATTDDHIFRTVLKRDQAVRIEGAQVTSMQPAPAQGLGTRLWIVPIALHDDIAPRQHFADLARREVAVVRIDNAYFDITACDPGGAQPLKIAGVVGV